MVTYGLQPNPRHILSQMPLIPDRLVLGGFHREACVEKLFRALEKENIPTFIDEDTTDVFLDRGSISLFTPLNKDIFSEM